MWYKQDEMLLLARFRREGQENEPERCPGCLADLFCIKSDIQPPGDAGPWYFIGEKRRKDVETVGRAISGRDTASDRLAAFLKLPAEVRHRILSPVKDAERDED